MNRHELKWALYATTEVLNARRLKGEPIPQELRDFHDELLASWESSDIGHETGQTTVLSPTLGVMEVAAMLHRTPRTVRRTAASIGAQRVNGTWVFDRAAVEEFARRKGISA